MWFRCHRGSPGWPRMEISRPQNLEASTDGVCPGDSNEKETLCPSSLLMVPLHGRDHLKMAGIARGSFHSVLGRPSWQPAPILAGVRDLGSIKSGPLIASAIPVIA